MFKTKDQRIADKLGVQVELVKDTREALKGTIQYFNEGEKALESTIALMVIEDDLKTIKEVTHSKEFRARYRAELLLRTNRPTFGELQQLAIDIAMEHFGWKPTTDVTIEWLKEYGNNTGVLHLSHFVLHLAWRLRRDTKVVL